MINSTKLKNLIIAIAILGMGTNTFAQMSIGGRAGINMNNLHGSSVNNNKMLIGYNVGGIFNYEMEELIGGTFGEMFSLQGEFTVQSKGAKFEYTFNGQTEKMNQVFTYVTIPILGKVNYPVTDKIDIFGEAGFFMSALVGVTVDGEKSRTIAVDPVTGEEVKRKWREEYKPWDFGIALGAGASMPIPNTKLTGYVNLRYSLGLSNIGEFSEKSDMLESELDGIKTNAFSFLLGVTYPIN